MNFLAERSVGRCKDGPVTNLLAERSFWVAVSTESSRIFWQSLLVGCGKDRSFTNFLAERSLGVAVRTELTRIFWQSVLVRRCPDGAIANFLALPSCGLLQGRRYRECSGRAFLWVVGRAELSRISWQSVFGRSLQGRSHHEFCGRAVFVGRCKDAAATNFQAEAVFCGSL